MCHMKADHNHNELVLYILLKMVQHFAYMVTDYWSRRWLVVCGGFDPNLTTHDPTFQLVSMVL